MGSGKHCNGIIKQSFLFLLDGSVCLVVQKGTLAVHDGVDKAALGLQPLVGRHVKGVLYAEADNTDRLIPDLMEVALALDTSIALGVVHRSVRCIHVDEQMKTLLHVHASTECLSRSQNYADGSAVHSIKHFLLGCNRHAAPDNGNLVCWYTLCDQFLTHVIVDVELDASVCTLTVLVITEHGYRTFVVLCGLQVLHDLLHGCIGLAQWLVRGIGIHQPRVDGCTLGNTVHGKGDAAVLLLLLTCHILKALQFCAYCCHDTNEAGRLREEYVLILASFLLGNLRLDGSYLSCQDGVGHLAPDTD